MLLTFNELVRRNDDYFNKEIFPKRVEESPFYGSRDREVNRELLEDLARVSSGNPTVPNWSSF